MKKAGYFFKEIWKSLAACFGTAAIFSLIGFLYGVSAQVTAYALLLTVTAAAVLFLAALFRFCSRSRRIENACRNPEYPGVLFPSADTLAEKRYQEMAEELLCRLRKTADDQAEKRQESLDYYSLWAHQIKTPIAAMHLLLQEEENRRQGQDEFARAMNLELFRTEQYAQMVLSYLRIGDISRDMVLCRHALDDMIRQAVRKYSRLFIIQKIRLDYRETEAEVLTDEKWLVFVIEQILSNALKYTKKGTITIYAAEEENRTALVIQDTGIGIAREDLPRVFERGFTGYNGRAFKKSTGIGLYLCKKVMDRLGHAIYLESEPGKGTRAVLELGRRPVSAE